MSTEARKIKKIVRKVPKDPFLSVPAGHTRRGAISTQEVEIVPRTTEEIAGTHSSEDLQRFAKSSLRVVREAAKKELKQRAETSLPDASIRQANRKLRLAKKRVYRTRKISEGHVYALTKPRAIEGYVTLTQLASERGIQPQLARIWMKKNGWVASAEGWLFKANSRELKKARKVLGLPPS